MRRTVLNVGLGLEWEPEKRTKIQGMNKQLESCRDFDCIQARVAQTTGHQEVYLVIDTSRLSRLVVESAKRLEQTSAFDMIWQNDELTVGRLAHAP